MKKILILLAVAASMPLAGAQEKSVDEIAFASADWHWNDLGKGAQSGYAMLTLFDSPQSISVVRYPARKFKTCIVNEGGAAADSTSALIQACRGIAGINASYFNMKTLYPTTYVKDDRKIEGVTTAKELPRVNGILTIRRSHKLSISACDTLGYDSASGCCREAIASGPVLLKDGEFASEDWHGSSFYKKRHPRTFIGTTADGWVYMVVIDGRFKGKGIGTTIEETAAVAKLFGLNEALNLDGGGSSTLWTARDGVINHPYDNKKFDHYGQRVVPNAIYIR